jgi:hypothetical protein
MLMHKVPQAAQALLRRYSGVTPRNQHLLRATQSHSEHCVVLILQTCKTCSERA